jgi:hypothetical protein
MTQQNLLILLIVGALIAVILVVGSWVDNGSSNFPQKIKLLEEQEDVQDVLSLSTRKMLFTRDWEERNRIEDCMGKAVSEICRRSLSQAQHTRVAVLADSRRGYENALASFATLDTYTTCVF